MTLDLSPITFLPETDGIGDNARCFNAALVDDDNALLFVIVVAVVAVVVAIAIGIELAGADVDVERISDDA